MKQMSYITRWLYSTSHKDIAILYLGYGMIASMVGTGMSVIIRMELSSGNSQFFHGNNQAYNVLITGHAIAMIFLFVMPVIIGAFGKIKRYLYIYHHLIYYYFIINKIFVNIKIIFKGISYYSTYFDNTFNQVNPKINDNLCSYITGLIEGNGNIYISNNINKSPKISIIFKNKDYELLIYLKNIFNIGIINKNNNNNIYIWQINKIEDINKLLNYTNGYYRTSKYNLIIKAIKWINEYIDNSNITIENKYNIYNKNIRNNILSKINKINIKSIDNSNILNNAWLAGFSDANSNFNIILNKSKYNESISLKYSLEIKQDFISSNINESFYPIMLNIAKTFNTNLYSKYKYINPSQGKVYTSCQDINKDNNKQYNTYYTYIININNINKLIKINNYYSKYKLLSSKYLDYKDWNKLLNIIINNNYKSTNINVVKLGKEIRNNFNKKRIKINFKHLLEENIYK